MSLPDARHTRHRYSRGNGLVFALAPEHDRQTQAHLRIGHRASEARGFEADVGQSPGEPSCRRRGRVRQPGGDGVPAAERPGRPDARAEEDHGSAVRGAGLRKTLPAVEETQREGTEDRGGRNLD